MSGSISLEVTWVEDSQDEVEFRPEEPTDGFHVINPSLPLVTQEFSWTPRVMAQVVEPPMEPERTLWSGA